MNTMMSTVVLVVTLVLGLLLPVHGRVSPRLAEPLCSHTMLAAGLTFQLDAWGSDSVRIRLSPDAIQAIPDVQALLPFPPGHVPPADQLPCMVTGQTLQNGNIEVMVSDDGSFTITRRNDGASIITARTPQFALFTIDSIYPQNYTLYSASVSYQHAAGQVYGLGEHKTGSTAYVRFQHLFQNSQVYGDSGGSDIMIPFYMSQAGFGLLMNQAGYGYVDIDPKGAYWLFNATHQLDLWVTVAPDDRSLATPFPSLSSNYADATGHPNPLPHFASGFWQSKDRYRNQSEIQSIASEFYDRAIPVEVFVIDWFHWQYLGDYYFYDTTNCWQDVDKMVDTLTSYGMHTMVSAWPRLDPKSRWYPLFSANKFLTYDSKGNEIPNAQDGTGAVIYDPFNPQAREALWRALTEGYVQHGIQLFWLDASEPEGSRPGEQFWSGKNDREIGMAWVRYHQQTIFEGMLTSGIPESEIVMLVRSGWVGTPLMNAVVWSGDLASTWDDFNAMIRMAPNTVLSGIHWYAQDIGGYHDGNYQTEAFNQLLLRWYQAGAFFPIFRTHGHRQPSEENEICGGGGGPNEVWAYLYSKQIAAVIALREAIRPYVEEHLTLASQTGVPIMAPMWYNFTDSECWAKATEDQWMFGPKFLVAPVLAPEVTNRSVYLPTLPSNENWVHYYSGAVYPGGQRVNVPVTLNDFPLFQREAKKVRVQRSRRHA